MNAPAAGGLSGPAGWPPQWLPAPPEWPQWLAADRAAIDNPAHPAWRAPFPDAGHAAALRAMGLTLPRPARRRPRT